MIKKIDVFLDDISSLVKTDSIFYINPSIPQAKLTKAIKSYAKNVTESEVIVLADTTLFGGAKEGFILTNDRIYCKELFADAKSFLFNAISSIEAKDGIIFINDEEFLNFGSSHQDALNLVVSLLASHLNLFPKPSENPEMHNLLEAYYLETKKVKTYMPTFDHNGILDNQVKDLFFIEFKKHHVKTMLSLKLNLKDVFWHIKIYNLILTLIKDHVKSPFYKQHLHKLYTNDVSIAFCFLWLKFCITKILSQNNYSIEKIESITNFYDYLIKAFVLYRDKEIINTYPNSQKLHSIFSNSNLGREVNNWWLYFNDFKPDEVLNNLPLISHRLFISLSQINDTIEILLTKKEHTEIDYEYLNDFLLNIYNQVQNEFIFEGVVNNELDSLELV